MNRLNMIAALAAFSFTATPWAQDAYVVGLSGAITGPNADAYAPPVESVRLYIDQLNQRGGVNGKPVRLIVGDNQGEPSKAAADAKKLSPGQCRVAGEHECFVGPGPMVARPSARARYSSGRCMPGGSATAKPRRTGSVIGFAISTTQMALRFIRTSREPVKAGAVAMAIRCRARH